MTTIDTLFELGTSLRDEGKLRDSVNVFSKILREYPSDKATPGTHTVLAGVYADLKEYDNALLHFKTATQLKPQYELASLGLYVTYVELNRSEDAIHELFRYLASYPAKLYKDTLEELLGDLQNGYLMNYEDDIKKFARQNGVLFDS